MVMDAHVIVPLYIFPSSGAWDAFYELASSHLRLQFTAIVNPNSGPADDALPNKDYTHAIQRLNAFGNVRVVGYVSTTWCMKNLSSVLDEIALYSGWGEFDSSLALSSIFFDETPTQFTPANLSFLRTIPKAVRASSGLKDVDVVKAAFFHFGIVRMATRLTQKPEVGGSAHRGIHPMVIFSPE
ncbi:hypothetical protein CC80DRAFT_474843 [Byssothecium circinans]|uniref:Amidohydrolase-related domain-containing protein n=1 Tax=Byssothecium circinans TaxID=147558 RepID=A0A6A5TSW5_9PLEO|nr:hypothetical protein CC80DRAFT_474843 [Byssothecium circinans]